MTYGERTISVALEGKTEFYDPSKYVKIKETEPSSNGYHKCDEDEGDVEGTPSRPLVPLQETDIANGRRFVADHGDNVRFVADWKRWVVFDGRRWAIDESETLVQYLAKETAIRMGVEAAQSVADAADKAVKATGNDVDKAEANKNLKAATAGLKHAQKTHDIRDIKRMLESAKSERLVNVQRGRDVFDLHHHLFNAWNGTIDLRDGILRLHRREDFLTRVYPTSYRQDALRGEYLKFLKKVFHQDPETAEYIRKLSGYVATGETCDHLFHIFHCDGSNGKGVITLLWTSVLGEDEYAHTAPTTLLVNDGKDRHPTEKIGLRGARVAIASESKQGGKLDESVVKNLTSEDMITARSMGQNFYRFPPTHKFILQTNHKPRLVGTDHGIRRRLRLVPFVAKFWKESDKKLDPTAEWDPEFQADPTLLERPRSTESEGILADMIFQARQFYENGRRLDAPTKIVHATMEYLKDEDLIGQFFDAKVKIEPDAWLGAAEFYTAFKSWWASEGHEEKRIPSTTRFGTEAKKKFKHCVPKDTVYNVRII